MSINDMEKLLRNCKKMLMQKYSWVKFDVSHI